MRLALALLPSFKKGQSKEEAQEQQKRGDDKHRLEAEEVVHHPAEERSRAHPAKKDGVEISHPAAFLANRGQIAEVRLRHRQMHAHGDPLHAAEEDEMFDIFHPGESQKGETQQQETEEEKGFTSAT